MEKEFDKTTYRLHRQQPNFALLTKLKQITSILCKWHEQMKGNSAPELLLEQAIYSLDPDRFFERILGLNLVQAFTPHQN